MALNHYKISLKKYLLFLYKQHKHNYPILKLCLDNNLHQLQQSQKFLFQDFYHCLFQYHLLQKKQYKNYKYNYQR